MVKFDEVGSTPHTSGGDLDKFLKFDFDGNSDFQAYLKTVEVSQPSAQLQWKLKARFYKKNVDPDLDIDKAVAKATGGASSAAPKPAPAPASTPAAKPTKIEEPDDAPRQRKPAASTPPPASARAAPPPTSPSTRTSQNFDIGFVVVHLLAVLSCAFLIAPVSRQTRTLAFSYCAKANLVGSMMRFYVRFGLPQPLTLAGLKDWALLAFATGTTEALHFMLLLQLVFFQRSLALPYSVFLISPSLMSLYHFLSKAKKVYGNRPWWKPTPERVHALVFSRKAQAIMISSRCEVLALFAFILDPLLGGRINILGAFTYYSFLKMRYFAPDSSEEHKGAWNWLNRKTAPYVARFPALQNALSVVQRHFLARPGQA